MEMDIAADPIAVGALCRDAIMTSPHGLSISSSNLVDLRISEGSAIMGSLVRRGFERLWAMILHMADLLETDLNVASSGRIA